MIPSDLFKEIAITVLSIGIIVSYVKPTFDNIDKNQNQIGVYKEELRKVAGVNDELSQLSASVSAIDAADQRRLLTYMPDSVDTIAVPRTLEAISEEAGVILVKITNEKADENQVSLELESSQNAEVQPRPEVFSMTAQGSYSQMKKLLRLIEQNEFPLEVTSLEVARLDGGFLMINILLTTYSRQLPNENANINEVTS